MKVTMIGHSTLWIDTGEAKILTDPYFGRHGNPAYARVAPPSHKLDQLIRQVDLVLVSHTHWDHVDPLFFSLLSAGVPVVAPHLFAWAVRSMRAKHVVGMRVWEQKEFGSIRVTAVPAAHTTVTRGYVIEAGGKQIYFAGDTYYREFMKEIGAKFALDLALMPVTTYRIPMTMGEEGAVKAVQALSPKAVIPIHLGITPRLPLMRTSQTPEGFIKRLRAAGLTTPVTVLHEGDSYEL